MNRHASLGCGAASQGQAHEKSRTLTHRERAANQCTRGRSVPVQLEQAGEMQRIGIVRIRGDKPLAYRARGCSFAAMPGGLGSCERVAGE
ncbi:hypothetical protein PSAC2689_40168 [Paraburkholderia sacchari]